jgi:hypothetical protein
MFLNIVSVKVVSLDNMKELYVEDTDFAKAWRTCKEPWGMDRTPYLDFHIQ